MFSIADFLALSAIRFYQHLISPRKGYRCAYSVAYGGTGCSGFAKQAIREHGLFKALPMIRHRFHDCANVADSIRADIDCGCLPSIDLPVIDGCGGDKGGATSSGGGSRSTGRALYGVCDVASCCDLWPFERDKKKKKDDDREDHPEKAPYIYHA